MKKEKIKIIYYAGALIFERVKLFSSKMDIDSIGEKYNSTGYDMVL